MTKIFKLFTFLSFRLIMENPSTISTRYGTTGNGIFMFLDNLVWVVYALSCGIYWSFYQDFHHYGDWFWIMTIYFFVWGVSVLLETLGTIRKHKISMIIGVVLSVIMIIIIGISVAMIGDFYLAWVCLASIALWNLIRLAFQIKVIRWISGNNDHPINLCGSCGNYAKNIRIPIISQTVNGYQSI